MKVDTIIFDLDGTISDPSAGITNCVNHALVTLGYNTVGVDDVRRLIGPPLTEIFEALVGEVSEERMLELVDRYRERYAGKGYRENRIYEGVPAMLSALANDGYQMGICTSKRADFAEKIVGMFGIGSYFNFVDGGDIHIKKYMQLKRLVGNGLAPGSAVMVGDRAVDIDAAKRNGIAAVGVCWGFGEREELERAEPDYLAATPADFLEYFS